MKKNLLNPKTPPQKFFLFLLTIFVSLSTYGSTTCGQISKLKFTNGTESKLIENGKTYQLRDLPDDFRLKVIVSGYSQSAKFFVKNLDTNETQNHLENELPYNFPVDGRTWDLGVGTFKVGVKLFRNNNGNHLCDQFWMTFTIADASTCGEITGYEFTNGTDEIALEDGATYNINDLPPGFYLEMNTSGASESAVFHIKNTNNGQTYSQTENVEPYNFPRVSNGDSWNLGFGTFQICGKLFANNNGHHPKCDQECITITIEDQPECGEITDLVFTNGTESITIQNGETYELSDLPDGFYLEMLVNGASESATYNIENVNTNQTVNTTENVLPYNYPGSSPWGLGIGSFKVDTSLFANNNAHHPKCDQYWVMFTIIDTPECGEITGYEFTNGTDEITLEDGGTYNINDLPPGFYLEMNTSGASESAVFTIQNTTTGQTYNQTENVVPYNFPRVSNGDTWDLGFGVFQICGELFANNNGHDPSCDQECITITIEDEDNCGEVEGFNLTNGTDSVTIQNGGTYNINDLPDGFYLEMTTTGPSESTVFDVRNNTTGQNFNLVDNEAPYLFPETGPWDLGTGTFTLLGTLYANDDGQGAKCDHLCIKITIEGVKCGSIDALEFTNGTDSETITDGATYPLSDLPDSFNLNLITQGNVGSVEYTVTNTDTGEVDVIVENVTPYTYPGGGNPWELGEGTFSVTVKLFELGQTQGNLCDELVVTFTIADESCNADAGTLEADQSNLCVVDDGKFTFDPIEISATPNGDAQVPAGFSTLFVLTIGTDLIILDTSSSPFFEVTEEGDYTIHTLVYDPNTLDLGFIDFGVTPATDILALLIQGGGDICGDLDVVGATIEIVNPNSGTLTTDVSPVVLDDNDEATVSATPNGDLNIPDGFLSLYILSSGVNLLIVDSGPSPEFVVNEVGSYTIHTLVYDPLTFDPSVIQPDVTTGGDLQSLFIQGGGNLCGSLDVTGAEIVVEEAPCLADAGTIEADDEQICVVSEVITEFTFDPITITATPNGDTVVPAGYSSVYVLTQGRDLIILETNTIPSFEVTEEGLYTIHTLVYDPATLDLGGIVIGQTTGTDIFSLLIDGGGDICGSLDVVGARIEIENPDAGTLTVDVSPVVLENGEATISATPNGDVNVTAGYNNVYILAKSPGSVIVQTSDVPSFIINEAGIYTIHSLVYDPNTLDLSTIILGVTSLPQLVSVLVQAGGALCGSLDTEGVSIIVEEEPCLANAGTIEADDNKVCVVSEVITEFIFDPVTITATPNGDSVVPAGFSSTYVLTEGSELVIIQTNNSPSFEVTEEGVYTIHTLVYDPATLDLGIVVLGETTGADVLALLVDGGGDICGALDVVGAKVEVENPLAGTLSADASPVILENGEATISATSNGDANETDGYSTLFILAQNPGSVIIQTSDVPSFVVNEAGIYTIHSLVYDPDTLDLGLINTGVTSISQLGSLLVQAGGAICGSLDTEGVSIIVNEALCEASAGTVTANFDKACIVDMLATISATSNGDSVVPSGYVLKYVLSEGNNSVILGLSNNPEFSIAQGSIYSIHPFVYDPNTINVNDIELGVTTSDDIYALTKEGGGNICASLNRNGVTIEVEDPRAGTLTADVDTIVLAGENIEISATPNGDINIPDGFLAVYFLTTSPGAIIRAINDRPVFQISTQDTFTFHTFVYNPMTFDLNTVVANVTSLDDILLQIVQGGGDICASLDVVGDTTIVTPDELALINGIKIYPNPAIQVLNIELDLKDNEELNYVVVDLNGRSVIKGQIKSGNRLNPSINLESLESGMYLITFTSNFRKVTKKIQIKN